MLHKVKITMDDVEVTTRAHPALRCSSNCTRSTIVFPEVEKHADSIDRPFVRLKFQRVLGSFLRETECPFFVALNVHPPANKKKKEHERHAWVSIRVGTLAPMSNVCICLPMYVCACYFFRGIKLAFLRVRMPVR